MSSSSEKDEPGARPRKGQRESVPYELEDHLALCKKTPRSDPDAHSPDTDGGGSRYDFEPGTRDTLTMEIPRMEGMTEERTSEKEREVENQGEESTNMFDSFLIRGAPLSPVTEIDEQLRSSRKTTGRNTVSTRAACPSVSDPSGYSRTQSGNIPTPKHTTSNDHPEHRSGSADHSSPVRGVIKSDNKGGEELQGEKSMRKSKDDLPKRQVTELMDVDEEITDAQKGVICALPSSPCRSPKAAETEMINSAPPRRRTSGRRTTSDSRRRTDRNRSMTPPNKRPSTRLNVFKEGVLQKLESEAGTWMHDLGSYLDVRLYELDRETTKQLGEQIDKLLSDDSDSEAWLEFLRLDLHKGTPTDCHEVLRMVRNSGRFPPSIETLYLWGLKMTQSEAIQDSYQALMRDYRQLKSDDAACGKTLLDTTFLLCHSETTASPLSGGKGARSTDLSLPESLCTLADVEQQLIQLLDRT